MGKDEQGVTKDRYAVIPRCLIFATRGSQVLLIQGSAHKRLWANRYNGIGGHIEQGEDVLSAARREFLEETGLTLIDPWLAGVITVDTGDRTGIGIFIFRGESSTGEPVESKEGKVEWVDESTYPNLPLVEDLYSILPKTLAAEKGKPTFFAQYRYDEQDQLQIKFG